MEFSKCWHENNQIQEVEITLCASFVSWILDMIFQPSPSSPDNNGSAEAGVSEGYSLYQDAF